MGPPTDELQVVPMVAPHTTMHICYLQPSTFRHFQSPKFADLQVTSANKTQINQKLSSVCDIDGKIDDEVNKHHWLNLSHVGCCWVQNLSYSGLTHKTRKVLPEVKFRVSQKEKKKDQRCDRIRCLTAAKVRCLRHPIIGGPFGNY